MSDHFHQRIARRLQELQQTGLRRSPRVVETVAGGRCRIDGAEQVNFGGNDYLDLAHDPRVCEAFRQAAAAQTGATASALVAGRSALHQQLEDQLADFEQTEAALLFPSGYAANLGVLTALVESRDVVCCDRDNHASIIDAARACPGQLLVYHRDRLDRLAAALQKRRGGFDHAWIVTDGVFSMDGTVAPLAELSLLAREHAADIIVDEAHGTGVLGAGGRGATELLNAEDAVVLRIGTLSKGLGGLGGFAAGDQATIDWLRNSARTQFFSTALPPAICAAMLASLAIVRQEPSRRDDLTQRTRLAHQTIAQLGLETVAAAVAPIVALLIRDETTAVRISQQLLQDGWFVPAIRPPTVRPGTSRLRLSLSCAHTPEQIVAVLTRVQQLLQRSKC